MSENLELGPAAWPLDLNTGDYQLFGMMAELAADPLNAEGDHSSVEFLPNDAAARDLPSTEGVAFHYNLEEGTSDRLLSPTNENLAAREDSTSPETLRRQWDTLSELLVDLGQDEQIDVGTAGESAHMEQLEGYFDRVRYFDARCGIKQTSC